MRTIYIVFCDITLEHYAHGEIFLTHELTNVKAFYKEDKARTHVKLAYERSKEILADIKKITREDSANKVHATITNEFDPEMFWYGLGEYYSYGIERLELEE